MVGLFVGSAEHEHGRWTVVPLVLSAFRPAGVVGVDVDEHMVEAAGRDLLDQAVHDLSLRILHVRESEPVSLVAHQEVPRAVFVLEMMTIERVHHQAAMNRSVRVRGRSDRGLRLAVERGHGRHGAHRPSAGHGWCESDLPCIVAVVESGHDDALAAGAGELTAHVDVERIPGDLGFEGEIVDVILLDRDRRVQRLRREHQKNAPGRYADKDSFHDRPFD